MGTSLQWFSIFAIKKRMGVAAMILNVGMGRFELPASSSRTKRASRAALHPVHELPSPEIKPFLQSFFTPVNRPVVPAINNCKKNSYSSFWTFRCTEADTGSGYDPKICEQGVGMSSLHKQIFEGFLPDTFAGLRGRIAGFLFRKAEFDQQSLDYISEYSRKGAVVFASFQSSNIALFMFHAVLRRHHITPPAFALDYNPVIIQPIRVICRRIMRFLRKFIFRKKYPYVLDTDHIETLLLEGKSVLFPILSRKFFLRRYLEIKYDSLRYFIELQRRTDIPIYFFPQMIFWNRNPERTNNLFQPSATSNRGFVSALIATSTTSYIRLLQPINLKEEIKRSETLPSGEIALRVRNKLIEMYQKEKRIVLGPVLRSQQEMVEKVLYHPNVLKAIEEQSRKDGTPENVLKRKAYKYFREIAADYSIYYIKVLEFVFDLIFRKIFNGITWDPEGLKMIREASKKGTVVLTPCHKSHMDYIILSYMFFRNQINPPHIAAGANLTFFPMGTIFRHCGAFFLRRSFKGLTLYSVVFKQYLKTLVQESYSIEFFIEGGRTRTGRLVYPKLGILHYLVDAIDEHYSNDLVFVPISIGYDRVLEEGSYAQEIKGKKKAKETMGAVVKSSRVLWRKHGMAYVNFDKPFTLKEIESENISGEERVIEIANRIIKGINRVTGIGPFNLATTAMLLMSAKGFSRTGLIDKMKVLHDYFAFLGVTIYDKANDPESFDTILDYVFASYHEDKIMEEVAFENGESLEDMHLVKEEHRARIAFYKNSVSHFLLSISFTSLAILACKKNGPTMTVQSLHEHFSFLKKLLSREFIYPDELNDEEHALRKELSYLERRGIITCNDDFVTMKDDVHDELIFFARALQEMLESYYIVLDVIEKSYRRKIASKEFAVDLRKNGLRLYHLGKIRLPESLSSPNYKSAIDKFLEDGYLTEEREGKKSTSYTVKDQVSPRKTKEGIEQFLSAL
jgi:glycerol-3-phosphate O-acyltransferase